MDEETKAILRELEAEHGNQWPKAAVDEFARLFAINRVNCMNRADYMRYQRLRVWLLETVEAGIEVSQEPLYEPVLDNGSYSDVAREQIELEPEAREAAMRMRQICPDCGKPFREGYHDDCVPF